MQDENDKLKELIQAVLDGKELQWNFLALNNRAGWLGYLIPNSPLFRIQRLCEEFDKYSFRIKPEIKTFKYKTRPYQWKDSEGKEELGLWTTTCGFVTETELEFFCEYTYYDMHFKWLAPATEHEVEYES